MPPIETPTLRNSPNSQNPFERPLTKECRPEGFVNEFTEHIASMKPKLMNLRQDYEKNEPEIQKITFPVASGETKKDPSLPKKRETIQKTGESTTTELESKEKKTGLIVEKSKTGEASVAVEKLSLPKKKEAMRTIVESTTTELGKVFGMEGETLTRLIHRESGFNEKAVNPIGPKSTRKSIGLMQITEVVFDDMKSRYKQFRPLFDSIKHIGGDIGDSLPAEARKALKVLASENSSLYAGKNAIEALYWHKENPYVNMIIGTIYLSFLKNQSSKIVKSDTEKNVAKIEEIQDKILGLDLKKINKQRKHTGHEDLTEDGRKTFVDSLKNDEDRLSQFLGLVQYNQGGLRGKAGIIYATVIMASNESPKKQSDQKDSV